MLNFLVVNFGKVQSKDMAAVQNLYLSLHLMIILFLNYFPSPKQNNFLVLSSPGSSVFSILILEDAE